MLTSLLARFAARRNSNRRRDFSVSRPMAVPAAESLEARTLLAGNVNIDISGRGLLINGDGASNNVVILVENGNVIARGLDNTTINGGTDDVELFTGTVGVGRDLRAWMGGGDDILTISGITVSRNARIVGEAGNDELALSDVTVGRHLKVEGRSGDDSILLDTVMVGKTIKVDSGRGNDMVFVDGSMTGDDLRIRSRRGDAQIRVENSTIGDDLKIKTRNGNDDVLLDTVTVADDLRLRTHKGVDLVRLAPVTVGDDATINLGKDDDQLQLQNNSSIGDDLKVRGGRGSDVVDDDGTNTVGDNNRQRSVEGATSTTDLFTARFDDATTGFIAMTNTLQNDVATRLGEDETPPELTLTLDTSANSTVQSNGTLLTDTADFQIDGTTNPGATVTIDADADGQFDDGTAFAGADGTFSITTTLTNTATNLGANTIAVRAEDVFSQQVNESIDVHFAVGTVSRFTTSQGTFDVELLDTDAPITVANFLNYGTRYEDSIIHRSSFTQTGGDFVIQGGGFRLNPDLERIPTDAAIQNEFNANNSNVRGTLSMALGLSPQSGTSQWFFNTVDNTFLDQNAHTVFGRVIGTGMDVVDAIHDLPIFDLRSTLDDTALGELPLSNYTELTRTLTGTVDIAAASQTVTGTGTSFTTELNVVERIQIGDEIFFVDSITSDTELELNVASVEAVSGATVLANEVPTDQEFVTIQQIQSVLFP